MHTIGIDFGTTKTLVSRLDAETGKPVTIRLGMGTDFMPTTVFIADSGKMYFGDEADDRLADNDGVYLRGFKMKLGSSVPEYRYYDETGNSTEYTARDLVSRFLRHVREKTEELTFMGESVTCATITRPVRFSPSQCEELRLAALDAGFEEVRFTTEPESAGLAFCRLNAAKAFRGSALIVDWGGGTLDFALVTRDNEGIYTHSELTDGDTTMGGERFDDLLWAYTEQILRNKGQFELNHRIVLPKIRKCKEKLSVAQQAQLILHSAAGVACPPIELTRPLFSGMISSSVEKAAEKVQNLIRRIPADKKPEMLLLVGGCSSIPYIRQQLEQTCQLPTVVWEHSRTAVALGAALCDSVASSHQESPQPCTEKMPSLHKGVLSKEEAIAQLDALYIKEKDYAEALSCAINISNMDMVRLLMFAGVKLSSVRCGQLLLKSIQCNDVEIVKMLLSEESCEVDCHTLEEAVTIADVSVVKEILSSEKFNAEGWTPLALAVITDNAQTVQLLLKAGHSPRAIVHDKSILVWAFIRNNSAVLNVLLNALNTGISKNEISATIAQGRISLAKLLLKIGESANVLLIEAASINNVELVRFLLEESGSDVNYMDKDGYTALMEAAATNSVEVARILIESGADVNVCSEDGLTTLMNAAAANSVEVARILIESGADVNCMDQDGWTALMWAADKNSVEVARMLIESGADVKYVDKDGLTALMQAAMANSVEVARILIESGADVNCMDQDGWTALMAAASENSVEVARILIESGADVKYVDKDGWTALMWAADKNSVEVARMLIESGADVNYENKDGMTALMNAAAANSVEVARILIESGADVKYVDKDGWTALMWAADKNSVEVARILIESGADVKYENKNGATALMVATRENSVEVARMLIEFGADVNYANKYGWTALMEAADKNSVEVARILIESGADVNYENKNGDTALKVATDKNSVEVARILIESGADVNYENKNGITALMNAAAANSVAVARMLIESGADVKYENKNGATALMVATRENSVEVARMLIEFGADVNYANKYGWTALMEAADKNSVEVARILIESGADVNYENKDGMTALMVAAGMNSVEVARILIESGADVNYENKNGWTALRVAADKNSVEVARILIESGADEHCEDERVNAPEEADTAPQLNDSKKTGNAMRVVFWVFMIVIALFVLEKCIES